LLYAVGIVDIACLGLAFRQLRRLVHIRHQRRWAPVKWLVGRLALGRSGAGVSDAAGVRDLELRRR
jgi:hypothetical protein